MSETITHKVPPSNTIFKEAYDWAKKHTEEFESASIRCGIIGQSGSGKSSLINAIAGQKIAEVGSVETTMDPQEFRHGGLVFVDLPGCGTERWPQDTYLDDLELRSSKYDCFIIVTANRLLKSDLWLYEELCHKSGKPTFVVRSKLDVAIQDEAHDNGLTEAQTIEKITKNLQVGFQVPPARFYLVSSRKPTQWDLEHLITDISHSVSGIKRTRFIADMAAYSRDSLEEKRRVAREIVSWSAVLAAANGLNPVPGLDVSVDLSILLGMSTNVADVYGLNEDQVKFLEGVVGGDKAKMAAMVLAKNAVAKFAADFLAKEAILNILKRIGVGVAAKNVAKYIPLIGQIVSAGAGYALTFGYGEHLINDSEKTAMSLLDAISGTQAASVG